MKKYIKQLKNERGLTLVELLAVIVILAIVATIAFVLIGNVIENSRKDAHVANAVSLIDAAKMFEANGHVIEGGEVKLSDLTDADLLEPLIDPWGNESGTYGGVDENEAVVTVDEDSHVYSVTFNSINEDECIIEDIEEETLLKEKRKVCKED